MLINRRHLIIFYANYWNFVFIIELNVSRKASIVTCVLYYSDLFKSKNSLEWKSNSNKSETIKHAYIKSEEILITLFKFYRRVINNNVLGNLSLVLRRYVPVRINCLIFRSVSLFIFAFTSKIFMLKIKTMLLK